MQELMKVKARGILERFAQRVASQDGVSTMSPAVYDTAWVSMISRTENGVTRWLFPECFDYLIQKQLPEGGWQVEACDTDAILNTAAGLWSLQEHRLKDQYTGCILPSDIDERIERACQYLQQRLSLWEISENLPVGFEILLPMLLKSLEAAGLKLDFHSREDLEKAREQKLSKFRPDLLYSQHETTLHHSLEAFIGKIEFDKVRHHLKLGAMMNSPSSTAAYLMNATEWDHTAEAYLRNAVTIGAGQGNGGVSSAFPSTTFETSWVLSTLLEAKIDSDIPNEETCKQLSTYLEAQLQAGKGISGFAPGVMADADDSAKSLECLFLLGKSYSVQPLITQYEMKDHFRTYPEERDPSTSANCNILIALLYATDGSSYTEQITKALMFLCKQWDKKSLKDKWNISPYYPIMRFSHALRLCLSEWDRGHLRGIPNSLITERIPIIATQMLRRLLLSQNSNGSWGERSYPEEAAYALTGLKVLSTLPWFTAVETQIGNTIDKATTFLERSMDIWSNHNYLWIEKVTYSSPDLSQTYCIAALSYNPPKGWGEDLLKLSAIHTRTKEIIKMSQTFAKLPKFTSEPFWTVVLSAIESFFYVSNLRSKHPEIFPDDGKDHKHLQFIPFTWVATNNLATHNRKLENDQIWDMIVLSRLNYQVDMYIETVVKMESDEHVRSIQDFVVRLKPRITSHNPLKRRSDSQSSSHINGTSEVNGPNNHKTPNTNRNGTDCSVKQIENVLDGFVQHSLSHPSVLASPHLMQEGLCSDLRKFLLAQIAANDDNTSFAKQTTVDGRNHGFHSSESLFEWLHGRGALHTSCPYSFAFFCALTDLSREKMFSSEKARYFAHVMRQHLAVACRLYNDYGSIERDRLEGQLNTVNWLQDDKMHTADTRELSARKEEILAMANFEDGIWKNALKCIEEIMGAEQIAALKVFVDVTDLYGQLYVQHDISSRVK